MSHVRYVSGTADIAVLISLTCFCWSWSIEVDIENKHCSTGPLCPAAAHRWFSLLSTHIKCSLPYNIQVSKNCPHVKMMIILFLLLSYFSFTTFTVHSIVVCRVKRVFCPIIALLLRNCTKVSMKFKVQAGTRCKQWESTEEMITIFGIFFCQAISVQKQGSAHKQAQT